MKVCLLLAGLLLTGPVFADDIAKEIDCTKAMDQSSMNICADRDYQAADKKLNAAYAKLVGALSDASFKAKLRTAEKTWIAFRDAECGFETAENEGGSIYPLVYAGCLTRLTEERTTVLEGLTACQKDADKCR